ncbi:MAG: 5-deoxy-glucuronate isomerase [bacterium]
MNIESAGSALIARFRNGFPEGYTAITDEGESGPDAGFDFGIYRIPKGRLVAECHSKESVWLLMSGAAEIEFAGKKTRVERNSVFDEAPTALHLGPGSEVKIAACSDTEWALAKAENSRLFEERLFRPEELAPEYRGEGLVQGACLRNVRLVFDLNSRKDSNLVIGEVVNYPGKWSSYPPHHHDQPEIYHYRFTPPQGYGHAELGDEVCKVRSYDTVKIRGGLDHSQVSAPGYAMYYIWVVRHLEGNPYTGFTFAEEHKWTLDPKNQGWKAPSP